MRGVFTTTLDRRNCKRSLARMVYGIVCFATLFSFVGTVLGGIWADQSWGRFWGWDPKENGALIIVLWNALILHARWGGMVTRARPDEPRHRRQHRHELVVVRHEHARHRPAQLRLHGRGVLRAARLRSSAMLALIVIGVLPYPLLAESVGKIGRHPDKQQNPPEQSRSRPERSISARIRVTFLTGDDNSRNARAV